MSSITFDASLNTEKLDSAIRESNKTVGDWAKGVEKAGNQADRGLNKMTKSFKEAIKDQKELIKSLEDDIKKLQKAYDSAAPGQGRSNIGVDIRSAKRSLALQNEELLNLQKQQIEANTKEAESTEGIVGKLKKWVIGLASVGAALKIAKGIIDSTAETQLKFEKITAEGTAAVQYFFRTIASGDWSNFLEGLVKATKGARKFVEEMESIENKRNELNIKTAELDVQIGEARAKYYDTDVQVQKAALKEIIDLQEKKFKKIEELSKEEYETNLDLAASASGLEKDKIEAFLKEYSSLEDLIKKGEEYNTLITARKRWEGQAPDPQIILDLDKQIEQIGEAGKAAGEYAKKVSNITPETRKVLSDFLVKTIKDTAAFNLNNRRDKQQLLTIEKQEQKDKIEAAKIENKIKAEQELLNKAIENNNAAEIKSIGEKIRKLQEELVLRERIAKAAIGATITRETPIGKISFKKPSLSDSDKLVTEVEIAKLKDQLKEREEQIKLIAGNDLVSGSSSWAKKMQKDIKENDKEQEEALKKQLELRKQIVNAAADLIYQIGDQIGLDEKSMALLNSGLNAFTALATGDIVGAAASMVSGIISQIPTAASRFEGQIEHINQLLEEQARLIELSEEKGGQAEARKDELDYLKEKERLAQTEYERLAVKAAKHLDLLGWRQKKADEAYKTWQDITNEIEDSNSLLDEFYTDTTASSIADAISQGFQEGKTSAEDFADTFNGFMISAINSALTEMSKPDIAAWYKQFAIDMESGGGLSKEEIAALKIDWDRIIATGKENREAMEQVTGVNLGKETTSNTGLTGIVRNITEDTGTELAGLFRRFADEQRVVKDYSIMGVTHLIGIEKNTYDTVNELKNAVVELQAINGNTKQVPTGSL